MATYMMAEQYPQAIAYAEKLLARSPRNHAIKQLMILAQTKTKAFDKAQTLLDKWIAELRKKPDNTQGDQQGMPITSEQMIGEFQRLKSAAYATAGKLDQADAYIAE